MTDTDQATTPGPTSEQLVAAIPHLTYRRLDWWIRQGYIMDDADPDALLTGSGHQRRYSPAEVLQARHMAHLVGHGVTVERAALAALHAERIWTGEWRWHIRGEGELFGAPSLAITWRLPPSQTQELADVLEVGLP